MMLDTTKLFSLDSSLNDLDVHSSSQVYGKGSRFTGKLGLPQPFCCKAA